jgi:hypothetical protein
MSKSRASWMRDGKFGMMVHWVPLELRPQYGRPVKEALPGIVGDFLLMSTPDRQKLCRELCRELCRRAGGS